MNLELCGDRIFVIFYEMEESVESTDGLGRTVKLHMPDKHGERTRIATIKAVGDEVTKYDVGDRVLVSYYTGVRVHLIKKQLFGEDVDEDRFRIIREEEILAKVID